MRLELQLTDRPKSLYQQPTCHDRIIFQSNDSESQKSLSIWESRGIKAKLDCSPDELKAILSSENQVDIAKKLALNVWGSTICVIEDRANGSRLILPDVAHSNRLFYKRCNNNIILDTELTSLIRRGEFEWNVDFLISFATTQFGISGQTPFAGINVVPPGCALLISCAGEMMIEKVWPVKAKDISLSNAVERVYNHLSCNTTDIVLALSGGVDSSASAIFMRQAIGRDRILRAVHLYTSLSPDYYETNFANKIAAEVNAELIPIDIEFCLPFKITMMDKPPISLSMEMLFAATRQTIQSIIGNGATIFEGEGGDLLFHAMPDVDVIEDAFLKEGVQAALHTASKLARLHNGSIPRAIMKAVAQGFRHHIKNETKVSPVGIGSEIIDIKRFGFFTSIPKKTERGLSHGRLVRALDNVLEITEPAYSGALKRINPLLAQPIVDVALGLSSYESFSEGNDRIVLRNLAAKFSDSDVIWRKTKGSFDAGIMRGLQMHKEQYFSLIDNGVLMEKGLISRDKILDAFHKAAVGQSSAGITLALIGCVEIYCASWKNYLDQPFAKCSNARELNA